MLRKRLKQIIASNVSDHPSLLEDLSREIENTIKILDSEHPIDRYTCFVYVFDFVEDPAYVRIATYGSGRVFAGPEFVKFLLNNNYLSEIRPTEVGDNDIVIYFNGAEIKHAGKISVNGRVISKWGIGHLFEHSIFEVPEQYGNDIRYYKQLAKETALDYFFKYAEQEGMVFKYKE